MRKVIQIIFCQDTDVAQGEFLALCDDGSIWDRTYKTDRTTNGTIINQRYEWNRIPGPPSVDDNGTSKEG